MSKFSKSKKYWAFSMFVFLFLCVELVLRFYWGFCDSPLCLSSTKYEYIYAPNQHRFRFRNQVDYNQFSQRSEAVNPKKKHVLGLGDSVINGGVITDQSELASSLFSMETGMQMLNISAGSWGPDNCAAYLREKGLFKAKAIVLVVSSHDAHDNMDFTPVVDVHPSYPSKQYKLACWELLDRFVIPRVLGSFQYKKLDPDQAVTNGIQKKGIPFNPGFEQLRAITLSAGIPLLVYLHPEACETQAGKYNHQGDEIISWATKNNIPLYKGLGVEHLDGYRDGIHLNAKGQRGLANSMEEMIKKISI